MTAAPRPSAFRETFLSYQPARISIMQPANALEKYKDIKAVVSLDTLAAAHTAGTATYAITLIDRDGLAHAIAADIDNGGIANLQALLAEAKRRGITAFAISSINEQHNGGHVWALYDQPFAPERGRKLIKDIAAAADVHIEAYPSGQPLRLPFAKHTWTQQYGTLILQNGQIFNLDAGEDERAAALDAVCALPRNHADLLPKIEQPVPASHTPQATYTSDTSIIQQFNRDTNVITLLTGYGCKVAERRTDGTTVLHCNCGNHAHGDRRPSLIVKPAKSATKQHVAFGYAPSCAFYTEHGQAIDAFNIFCHFERLSAKDAVAKLAPPRLYKPKQARIPDPEPEPPPHMPTAAERRRRERERQERIAEAHATQAEIRARAEADSELSDCARRVLEARLTIAGDRDWERASNKRIADMTGLSVRSVQRGTRELEARGYIERDPGTAKGGLSTTIRRFLRVTAQQPEQQPVSPVLENKLVLNPPDLACEPGHDTPAPEPVIAFDGGASYTPVDLPDPPAREWRQRLPPKEFYTEYVAPRERRARQAEQPAPVPQPVAPVAEQHEMEIAPSGPSRMPLLAQPPQAPQPKPKRRQRVSTDADALPADKAQALADKYGRLMGKVQKVEHSNPRQAAKLRRQAADVKQQLDAMPLPIEVAIEAAPAVDSQAVGASCAGSQAPPKGEGVEAEPIPPALSHLPDWQAAQRWADWCKRFPRGGWERDRIATECVQLKVFIGDVWPVLERVAAQEVQHG